MWQTERVCQKACIGYSRQQERLTSSSAMQAFFGYAFYPRIKPRSHSKAWQAIALIVHRTFKIEHVLNLILCAMARHSCDSTACRAGPGRCRANLSDKHPWSLALCPGISCTSCRAFHTNLVLTSDEMLRTPFSNEMLPHTSPTMQAVAPSMIKRQSGRIIIVGSITAALASPFNGAYAVSHNLRNWTYRVRYTTSIHQQSKRSTGNRAMAPSI